MIRQFGAHKVWVAVISARRPGNVRDMTMRIGDATWYVNHEDEDAYLEAGVAATEVQDSLVHQRNKALSDAWSRGLPCVQSDDDLKSLRRLHNDTALEVPFEAVVAEMLDESALTDFKLIGCSTTDNLFFAKERASTNLFVSGALMVVKPCSVWFDPRFLLKEDYDYTCQHFMEHGGALRINWLIPKYLYGTGKGGCVSYRTPEMMQQMNALLKEKWPGWIVDNPKRPDEVLLRLPRRERVG